MDILSYGWVANIDDATAWENGIKWLSKAIVSDRNGVEKEQLKELLELHLKEALARNKVAIQEVGVFYALAWKRFDVLELYWDLVGPAKMAQHLQAVLPRIFVKYEIDYFDFSLLVFEDRARCLSSLTAFFNKRKIAHSVVQKIASRFFSDDNLVVSREIKSLAELIGVLGVSAEPFFSIFDSFLEKQSASFLAAIEKRNFIWCVDALAVIEPLREYFLQGHSVSVVQRGILRLLQAVPLGEVTMVLVAAMRWRIDAAVASYFSGLSKVDCKMQFVEVVKIYFGLRACSRSDIVRFACFLLQGGSGVVGAFLGLMCGSHDNSSALIDYFENSFHRFKGKEFLEAHFSGAFLRRTIGLYDEQLEQARNSSLRKIWQSAVVSSSRVEWQAILDFFGELYRYGLDRYIEDEYLLPLLREGMMSASHFVNRVVIVFAKQYAHLYSDLVEWLSAAHTQFELTEQLFVEDVGVQVAAINRLISIYYRVKVNSVYLLGRLDKYALHIDGQSFSASLRKKLIQAVEGIKEQIAE